MDYSFLLTAPALSLPQDAALPSGTGCSSTGPLQGHKPRQQTCSRVGSSLHGSTGPARTLLQCGLPMGSQPSFEQPTSPKWASSMGCRWISALPWTSMGCKVTACSPWSAPQPASGSLLWRLKHLLLSFFTDLGVWRVVSVIYSHSSLLWPQLLL